LGGQPYHGRSMKAAHAKLNFDKVLENLDKAMASLNVPQDLMKEVLAIAETTRNDVLGRDY
jgi:hemoglobin